MTAMNTQFPAEPMAAFYAAVAAVENGQVGEIELTFSYESDEDSVQSGRGYAVTMAIEIRKHPKPELLSAIMGVEKTDE